MTSDDTWKLPRWSGDKIYHLLHIQISTKLSLFKVYNISSINGIIMAIKRKNKIHNEKITKKAKEGYWKAKRNFGNGKNPSSLMKSKNT